MWKVKLWYGSVTEVADKTLYINKVSYKENCAVDQGLKGKYRTAEFVGLFYLSTPGVVSFAIESTSNVYELQINEKSVTRTINGAPSVALATGWHTAKIIF